jgi:putative exosortase-associated protein (TIGR04073 family)
MKNRLALLALILLTFASPALADIQSPPGHHFNWSRKLSRGLGSMIFSPLEFTDRWRHTVKQDGPIAAASDVFIEAPKRILVRLFYGVYEVTTFPFPTWKLTYRPPYYRKEYIDNWWGYTEFPLQMGSVTQSTYSRTQTW